MTHIEPCRAVADPYRDTCERVVLAKWASTFARGEAVRVCGDAAVLARSSVAHRARASRLIARRAGKESR